jgi:hypothetical protein
MHFVFGKERCLGDTVTLAKAIYSVEGAPEISPEKNLVTIGSDF